MTRKTSNRKGMRNYKIYLEYNMKEPILIKEYEVETSVEDWTEVSITHKLISKKYLKFLMQKFQQLPFASKVYYADNGVFRICMRGNEKGIIPVFHKNIPDDICIFPHKGYCTIMRNEKQGYYEMEQQVINIICESLDEWKIEKKLRKELLSKIAKIADISRKYGYVGTLAEISKCNLKDVTKIFETFWQEFWQELDNKLEEK